MVTITRRWRQAPSDILVWVHVAQWILATLATSSDSASAGKILKGAETNHLPSLYKYEVFKLDINHVTAMLHAVASKFAQAKSCGKRDREEERLAHLEFFTCLPGV